MVKTTIIYLKQHAEGYFTLLKLSNFLKISTIRHTDEISPNEISHKQEKNFVYLKEHERLYFIVAHVLLKYFNKSVIWKILSENLLSTQ